MKKPTVEKTRSLVKVDMSVTARFHEDKMWYPAKVLKVLNDGKFVVLFTEYGNEVFVCLFLKGNFFRKRLNYQTFVFQYPKINPGARLLLIEN